MQKDESHRLKNKFFLISATIETYVAISFLSLIVITIFYQVVARSIFKSPLTWAEELSTYLFIWMVYIGSSMAYKKGSHIVIRTFVSKCNIKVASVIQIVTYIVIIYVSIIIIKSLFIKVIPVEMKSFSVALPIKLPKACFFSIPYLYCIFNILIYTVYMLYDKIRIVAAKREA